ncbi:hypothetical protein D7V64_11790 [Acinetobacter cumulans]|uniref:Uncharacterized protein n=1 Tax=Acinetobacter cumulans TaxID=2136182 RepID=A0A3A8FXK5_9GAMM|nr:hypothetical protein [Acinetobacter cumulans]RKG51178.1 hypothetical protein D7V64_11790 [Acinetobacter cumulans]
MNEPSASLWKKLNEVTDKLQKVSEQLIESNAINKGYHKALDQHRIKIEALERENNRAQGAISFLRWVGIFLLSLVVSGGGWTISSINQLKQDVAVMQSHREDRK